MTTPANPKDLAAQSDDKVRLDLLEPPADDAIARVLAHGADKYGLQNYRTIPIHYRTYIAATRRHLKALLRGEDLDPDSGESHWAHVGANVHVVMAAIEEGTLVDDRGPAERTAEQESASSNANQFGGAKEPPRPDVPMLFGFPVHITADTAEGVPLVLDDALSWDGAKVILDAAKVADIFDAHLERTAE